MNSLNEIYINELKNEFLTIAEEIIVPAFSVKEISFSQKHDFDSVFRRMIPEYIENHTLLEQPVPKSDTHFIHYVENFHGKYHDFLHVYKIDLKFSGDSTRIIEKGNPDFYPSYRTDRLYFKSYVIPVKKIIIENRKITGFEAEPLMSKVKIESDRHFNTFALFDEFDKTGLIEKLNSIMPAESLPVLYRIYSFWDFQNFTFSMNIPFPDRKHIETGIELFESAWIAVKSEFDPEFRKYICGDNCTEYRDLFSRHLEWINDSPQLTDEYKKELAKYLAFYSFHTDDDLAIKRWRRIDISK